MNKNQQQQLSKVRDYIGDIRGILDDMMYGSEQVSDDVYNHLRTSYNLVCQANDELLKV